MTRRSDPHEREGAGFCMKPTDYIHRERVYESEINPQFQ